MEAFDLYIINGRQTQLVTTGRRIRRSGFTAVTEERLTPKGCIILQQVVDVSNPIIFFSRPNPFLAWPFVSVIGDGRAINARYWIR